MEADRPKTIRETDAEAIQLAKTLLRTARHGALGVLDPRTGLPAQSPWRTVTATGSTCVAANTASTAALVLGPDAVGWLERRTVPARLVPEDGDVVRTGSWPAPRTTT